MSRSPILAGLKTAFRLAEAARRLGTSPGDVLSRPPLTRRRTVLAGIAGTIGAVGAPGRVSAAGRDARVAIVGAGLAGLVAARRLLDSGVRAVTVYEANTRLGGRMLSLREALGPGVIAELGGSFINSDHEEIITLCRQLGLELEGGAADGGGPGAIYFVDGRRRSIRDIADASEDVLIGLRPLRDATAEADRRSAADWLDQFKCRGWLRTLLDIGLTQEMGLEPDRMSGYYLASSFDPKPEKPGLGLFSSDQRYQIKGGNDRLPAALAATMDRQILRGWRLEAVRRRERGVTLSFARHGGQAEVTADIVVLALPPTTLRQVDLRIGAPAITLRAIREMGFGTNAKLLAGLSHRPWRAEGMSGECLNDLGLQAVWEDHPGGDGAPGSMTIFAGGRTGVALGNNLAGGRAVDRARDALRRIERVFPGVGGAFNGRATAMHWPSNPYVGGSYSCFAPGQFTALAGAFAPMGAVVFAGEHTSDKFSGYMNGAAESGRVAADEVTRRLR